MSFDVEMPDGTVIQDVPDGTTKEMLLQKYMTHQKQTPPSDRSFGETVAGHAKAATTGIANAVTGFAGLPGEVQEVLGNIFPKHPGLMTPKLPTREDIKSSIGDQTGMSLYKPQTQEERYTSAGVEGGASLFNPFDPRGKAAPALGFLGGLGGEALSQGMPGNKFARIAGEAPFLTMAMALMAKKPQSAKMLEDWMKATGEDKIRAGAQTAEDASAALGTKVMVPQGMEDSPIMGTLMELAKSHPQGTKVQDLLRAQREATIAKTKQFAEDLSPRATNRGSNNSVAAAILGTQGNMGQFGATLGGTTGEAVDQFITRNMRKTGVGTFKEMTAKIDAMDPRDIREVATTIGSADKSAFPVLVKKSFLDKWDAAQGKDPFKVASLWRGEKGTQQAARFDAKVEEAAKANGLDPQEARLAANELMDAIETASRGQGPGRVGEDLRERAGSDLLSGLLKSVGINAPFHRLGYTISEHNANKVIEGFIDAMTSGDMTKKLIALSQFNNLGHKTKAVARTLMSVGVQQQPR
jgi:hypothetical protein